MCGAMAGGVSAALTTPLDVAKTRIMLAGAESEEARAGTLFILRSVLRESGEYSLLVDTQRRLIILFSDWLILYLE